MASQEITLLFLKTKSDSRFYFADYKMQSACR